jgi:hypothetical protein
MFSQTTLLSRRLAASHRLANLETLELWVV